MKVSLLLHIYQPSTQFFEITKKAVEVSYQPILNLLEKYPQTRITLDICGSLTEQLESMEYHDVLEKISNLGKRRQIEFVGSAKYHPLLPEIPKKEILRQIRLNEETNQRFLGEAWKPQGFFPPEMAYSQGVKEALIETGYQWVLLDESAHPGSLIAEKRTAEEEVPAHERLQIGAKTFVHSSGKIRFLFRDREQSLEVAYAKVTSVSEFLRGIPSGRFQMPEQYLILAMDGETFGFHHPEMMQFLEELFVKNNQGQYELIRTSEIFESGYPEETIEPRQSTWGTTVEEEKLGRVFPRWHNPQNPIHNLQWQLLNLAIQVIDRDPDVSPEARSLLDQGLQSDQFWWASHNPCWHPPMIERGAKLLLSAIQKAKTSEMVKKQAVDLYDKIKTTGLELFGEKVVAC